MNNRVLLILLSSALQSLFNHAGAHTEIMHQAIEGQISRNAVEIGHGCETQDLPVIAQSLIIPTVNPIVTRSDGTTTSLASEITVDTLEGLIDLPQNKDIFKKETLTRNSNGNVIGYYATQGRLQTDLKGELPVNFGPVFFQPQSCARSLMIQIPIADICKKKSPPQNAWANLWIPNPTTKFPDTGNDGMGSPAVLTIVRDSNAHPLPANCENPYDVTVSPSNEDIDNNLTFKGWGK